MPWFLGACCDCLCQANSSIPNAPERQLRSSSNLAVNTSATLLTVPAPKLAQTRPLFRYTAYQRAAPPSLDSDSRGSTNVSMDSWIYPVLERLSSMGLIPSQSVAIRPWTRQERRRQMREAEDILNGFEGLDYTFNDSTRAEASRILPELEYELREPHENGPAVLESVYVRVGTLRGPALTDSFHFSQTWWNDFGRPLGRGSSAILGYSVQAISGRPFFYNRQELQTDPGLPAVPQAQANLFSEHDNVPFRIPAARTIPPCTLIASPPAITGYVRQRRSSSTAVLLPPPATPCRLGSRRPIGGQPPWARFGFQALPSRPTVGALFLPSRIRCPNKGFLLGNATGRDARAYEGRVGYWVSDRTRVEGAFRRSKGSRLLPGGSSISDVFTDTSYGFSKDVSAQVFAQDERFLIPSYLTGPQRSGSARLQITSILGKSVDLRSVKGASSPTRIEGARSTHNEHRHS